MSRALRAVLVMVAAGVGCRDASGPDPVSNVKVEPEMISLQVGSSMQLSAFAFDAAGDTVKGRAPRWEVADRSVATIDASGKITAVAAGVSKVTATVGPAKATRDVFVTGFSTVAFLSDDFRIYGSTADLLKNSGNDGLYTAVVHEDLIALDNTVRFDGHQTVKFTQPTGTSRAPWLFPSFPEPKSNVWFRARVRFSPGWRPPTGGDGDTFFHWGWFGSADYRGGLEVSQDRGYQLTWYASGASAVFRGPAGAAGAEWDDGQWYDYIIHYAVTSATQAQTRFWLGRTGTRPTLRGTLVGTMASGSPPPADRVLLGQEFYTKIPNTQAVWIGTWEVADGSTHADPFDVFD